MAKKAANEAKKKKYVYFFGAGKTDGNGSMSALLGKTGANLAEMSRIGLPVSPGFTVSTETCTYYHQNKKTNPSELQTEMKTAILELEQIMKCCFGDTQGMPLVVTVRPGARDSLPGMASTLFNIGLNDDTVHSLANATNNERFAWESYCSFIQKYARVVLGVKKSENEFLDPFDNIILNYVFETYHKSIPVQNFTTLDLSELAQRFKKLVRERTHTNFPSDPWEQLHGAVGAVFDSWMSDQAVVYRQKYDIPTEWGTAVNVQVMVPSNDAGNVLLDDPYNLVYEKWLPAPNSSPLKSGDDISSSRQLLN